MWAKLRKLISLKKATQLLIILAGLVIVYGFWTHQSDESNSKVLLTKDKEDDKFCDHESRNNMANFDSSVVGISDGRFNSKTRQHALLFLQDGPTSAGQLIMYMFQATRMKYHVQYSNVHNLPALIDNDKGCYATVVFEDVDLYLNMNKWNREILDKFCIQFDVGVIFFILSEKKKTPKALDNIQLGDFPLVYTTNLQMKNCEVNPSSVVPRVMKSSARIQGVIGSQWSVFKTNHTTYQTVLSAMVTHPEVIRDKKIFADMLTGRTSSGAEKDSDKLFDRFKMFSHHKDIDNLDSANSSILTIHERIPIVLHDTGKYDGIQRIFFGSNLELWFNKILFLDALSVMSHGKLSLPLERYMQVDVDDIFVSIEGLRMKKDDVMEMIDFQEKMGEKVPGFKFLLGFSGKFYQKGKPEEKEGDATFLKESSRFLWFPHMWSHMQAHLFNKKSKLCDYMKPNKEFAERHKFNVSSKYAVAPHHSGIYPVHEPLYSCWKEIWGIEITSTEEYPNLRPDTKRRAFVYRGIKVLPRQTCGLFTHTNFFDKYPGGISRLNGMIEGGQLFQTLLLNKYNIYMTHFSNYGNDRLALYTFGRLVDFVQCWTNLKLLQIPPSELAEKYFEEYPDEVDPVWTNPCIDPRHLEIWSKEKSCDMLPKFVIVGPQKTGTTALHWFLKMHPNLQPSLPSKETFEEVQFFNDHNYFKGLDWYMDFFRIQDMEDGIVFYEKSANYFSQPLVPRRLTALLPKAHVIVVLIDPTKRAYSWYQHMRSHNDPIALNYTFYEVLKAKRKSPPALLSLQSRCLIPGRYAEHADRWLEYVSPQQLIIVDGESLVIDPVSVLEKVQRELALQNVFNYSKAIRFDSKKGFFCKVDENGSTKCLGKGKGRQYPEMPEKARAFLNEYYLNSNKRLLQILTDLKHHIPNWLIHKNTTVT